MTDRFAPKEHNLSEEDLNKIKYTNLKNHTGYTLQMGFGTTKEHLKTCAKKGHQGCVFTDNGVMMGALDLYNTAQDKKLLESIHYEGKSFPIIMGVSLYLTEDTNIKNRAQKYYSITLYAKNQSGYENLCYLTSIGSLEEKFYVRPRIDLFDLFTNKTGVICASGGFSGMLGQAIAEDKGYFREELFNLIQDPTIKKGILDYLDKFHETNSPDKVSKLIDVMQVPAEKEEFWRKYLTDASFWEMFPILLRSPELLQLLKDTQDKFPLDKVDFILPETMQWNVDDSANEQIKGAFLNILTDIKPELIVERFKAEFKDDFYFEMSNTDLRWRWVKDLKQHEDLGENPQDKVNRKLVELSERYGVKIVLVQDSYIPDADQHLLQSIMIWNSPSGKDGWHFYEALEIMTIPSMYEKTINNYPWISDEQFLEWTNNSDEVLKKCKDCRLSFEPSLPILDYENHYVNKVPAVIRRSLMFELQERKLWSETLKAKIIDLQDLSAIDEIPDDIKQKFPNRESVLDLEDMEKRKDENVFLEEVLLKMKTFYKKEKELVKLLKRSENDLALRTALKVMIRNKKLLPKIIDEDRLNKIIAERAPGKTFKDFKPEVIQNIINKYNLFKIADDPMLLLGGDVQRARLVEEVNTIQYNGILKLMSYFMLLEDVSNFVAENGYLRGFGRGCLTGDTLVLTQDRGFVKLKDIKDGDVVFTHNGNAKPVIKTFRYEVDEELLEIVSSNSKETIKLTSDHKVYGVKRFLTEKFKKVKNKNKVAKYEKITHKPEFFPASELKAGDLLFIKKPSYKKNEFEHLDLAKELKDEKVIIGDDSITWLNPLTKQITYTHDRFLKFDEDFFYFLGKWVGDGHFAFNEESRKYVVAIAFNKKDVTEIVKTKIYFEAKGFSVGEYPAKDRDLVSLEIYSKPLAAWFKKAFPEYKNTSNTKYLGHFKYAEEKKLISLVKGVISADGHVSEQNGKNRGEVIDTTSPQLKNDLLEVFMYLNIPNCVVTREEFTTKDGFVCKKSYKIKFTGVNLENIKMDNKVYEDGYYVKVKEINKVPAEPVYDLMIADEPSYLTSNFVVHNSGAGSIVAYALDITDCDPLEYNLLFERFLTTERIGEVFYEIEGFSLKEFLASQNQEVSTIDISVDDLKLDDEPMDADDNGEPGEDL